MLAVILIHCPTEQNYPAASWGSWLTMRQLIDFPVATFVFMAGYFVNSEKVSATPFVKYLTNRGGTAYFFHMQYGV